MDVNDHTGCTLLNLPPELRLRIYDFIEPLQPGAVVFIVPATSPITPAIARICRTIRQETLPIYATNAVFCIGITSASVPGRDRISIWQHALGPHIRRVQELRLSRVWDLEQPTRHVGHIGFYLYLKLQPSHKSIDSTAVPGFSKQWECDRGTHPVYKDVRGMRLESANLLQEITLSRLNSKQCLEDLRFGDLSCQEDEMIGKDLDAITIDVLISLMDVVAAHPIPLYDFEQTDSGRQRRRHIWESMERKLRLIADAGIPRTDNTSHSNVPKRTFHTPY